MRIAFFIWLLITIIAMFYYLTWNPLLATECLLKFNAEMPRKEKVKKVSLYVLMFVAIAITWNLICPKVIAYYGQPLETKVEILKKMPQYNGSYVIEVDKGSDLLQTGTSCYFMDKDSTKTRETAKWAKIEYITTEAGTDTVEIIYQSPKVKTWNYFFMDYLTWPKKPYISQYRFNIDYRDMLR